MTGPGQRLPNFVPLRSRLMFLISAGVLLFGSANLVIVGRVGYRALAREQQRRLSFIGRLLAQRAVDPILRNDRVELDTLLRESLAIDSDLTYVLITGRSGEVLAHTFENGVPAWIAAPARRGTAEETLVELDADPWGGIRELAVPILEGRLGTARVGVRTAALQRPVVGLLSAVAAMVLCYLVVGLVAARWVARRITAPLERLVRELEKLELDGPPLRPRIETGDELELLASEIQRVTDRLQALHRQERERAREMARIERLAALGTLTAGLAHELNNPLAGIKSAAQRLQSRPGEGERVRRYATLVEEAVRRMERLLQDMLSFSRSGEVTVRRVAVCPAVESAAALATPRLKQSGATFSLRCPAGCPNVQADPDRLVQAVVNLLINAADAVAGCDRREILVRAEPAPPDKVRLEVADTGPGVDAAIAERIFNPFFTTKPPGRGTGLGLSAAWTAIREMGGTLELANPGQPGARFVITLPEAPET